MKKRIATLLLVTTMVLSLTACAGGESGGSQETGSSNSKSSSEDSSDSGNFSGEIRFAVIGPMTGNDANSGFQHEAGVHIAVDEINNAGGIDGKKLVYDVFDDQLIPDQSVICAEKIVAEADKYRFIVAPLASGCTNVILPICEKANLPVIGCNSMAYLTDQGYTNFLRCCYTDAANLGDLLNTAVNDYECKKPAIVYTSADIDTERAEWMTEQLNESGIEVAVSAKFEASTEKDFSTYLTNIKAADCDVIFLFAEYSPCGLFLKQKENMKLEIPVMATSGAANPNVIDIAGSSACESLVTCTGFFVGNPDEDVQKFVSAYSELTEGQQVGEPAALTYDAIKIMANALENDSSLEGMDLVNWLKENTDYNGMQGPVKFDETGDNIASSSYLITVKDGQFALYES